MTLKLSELPEIEFANRDISQILSYSIMSFEKAFYDSTGIRKTLYPGDPIRIWIYTQALREVQLRQIIDDSAKQNLLKYSRGDYLRNLGAFTKTEPLKSKAAYVPMLIRLSQVRTVDTLIPMGTRVSSPNNVYFSLEEDLIIPSGKIEGNTIVKCLEKGVIGNGFLPGQINVLVDPIPWVESVENTEESQGGADAESEESYRNRIHLAPEGFSVAGPEGAYEFYARQYSSLIKDVKIYSPSPGVVKVCVLLDDGETPTDAFLDGLAEYLSDKERRPLTDNIQVSGPTIISYDLEYTYYISRNQAGSVSVIQNRIDQAVQDYVLWQRSKIGRDISPDEFILRLRQAGAKRVSLKEPGFQSIEKTDLAVVNSITPHYGGLEDE